MRYVNTHSTAPGRCAALLGLLLAPVLLLTLGACQTQRVTTSDSRPMPPKPRAITAPPTGTTANRMTLLVGQKAADTNGNGYPDRIEVSSTLFAWPNASGMQTTGEFRFALYQMGDADRPNAVPLAEWAMPITPEHPALARTIWGYSYNFKLSLTAARGSDELPAMRGDLRGRFIPAGDAMPEVACSAEVRLVQLGRSSHAGATLGQ